jgi:glutaredoxin
MNTIQLLALSVTVLASVLATPASAQYRWTDASGKVHYGDSPPRDAKDVRPLGQRAAPSGAGGDATVGLPYEVRRAMERAPVVLYTSPECPPCAPAAALLRERGVPFAERSVRSPDDLQEFRRISGGLRLPYLTVGSQSQSGFEPDAWLSLLDAAGYPKGSMLPRSYQWPAAQPLVPPAKPEGKPADAAAEVPAPATPAAKR